LVGFARGFETGRAQQGTLTFDDLILLTRDVVCTNAGVAEAIRDRYDVLLVDEFQDTDPSQMEIARRFATDPSTGSMDPGRLFIVGDPKQSIYRFRNADMTMYTHTQELLKESGARVLSLLQNKRSRRVIVDWVNTIFPSILGSTGDSVRVRYQPITHTRDVDLKGPGVAWFGHEVEAKARESRNMEAQGVAAVCRTAIAENWEVSDRVGNITTSRNRDIAILIPRRTGLIALERALSAEGVPYRVEGGSLIYGTQEVRDLINCLTAIEDPSDQVAIVGALRSPAFACSDVDLARHKAAGGRFSYGHPDLDQWEGPVADALRVLASYNARRHDQSIAALIEEFVAERGILDAAILDRCGRNVYRRMRFVAQQARAFEAAGPESIHSFVSWLEGQAKEAILDNEGAGVDDDEDAVRVLTIHGAKGLEFPIVILAGLTAAPLPNRSVTLADHGSGRVAIHAGSSSQAFDLGPLDDLQALEAAHGEAEFARLLYVGATRARDHLVVSLYRGSSAKPNCAARMLIDAGIRDTAPELTVRTAPRGAETGHFESVAIELPDYSTADVFGERRASLIRSARRRTFTSATALGRATDRSSDETEPWARGRGGTRLGRAVHAAVQALPLEAEDSVLDAVCRAQAVAEAIPHKEGDVKRLVRWITRHSVAWQRARKATRAMREVPFALVIDDKVLEGFIDLVIETAEGLEIVDWKTDQISGQEVDDRLNEYRLQAGLYTHGLQAATGRSVTAVNYVFAQPGLEVTPGEPEELAHAAIARLRSSDVPLPE
jgi:ATP-dependent exoDNAse (exonuclease V) beta subunit